MINWENSIVAEFQREYVQLLKYCLKQRIFLLRSEYLQLICLHVEEWHEDIEECKGEEVNDDLQSNDLPDTNENQNTSISKRKELEISIQLIDVFFHLLFSFQWKVSLFWEGVYLKISKDSFHMQILLFIF